MYETEDSEGAECNQVEETFLWTAQVVPSIRKQIAKVF